MSFFTVTKLCVFCLYMYSIVYFVLLQKHSAKQSSPDNKPIKKKLIYKLVDFSLSESSSSFFYFFSSLIFLFLSVLKNKFFLSMTYRYFISIKQIKMGSKGSKQKPCPAGCVPVQRPLPIQSNFTSYCKTYRIH